MTAISPGDRERIAAAARRLGIVASELEALAGGSRNRSYRLRSAGQDLVARVAGEHDAAYAVVRDAEWMAQGLAAAQGLAPRLLLEDREAGIALMAHVPGPVWRRARAASAAGAAEAGAWLRRLHVIELPPAMPRVDFRANLELYCRQLPRSTLASKLLREGREVAAALAATAARPPVLCHNDLHHHNLIESPAGLIAVDWEYAGAGDAVMDLAGYVAYHDLGEAAKASLMEAYGERDAAAGKGRLALARWLFEAVWWAWLELRRRLDGEHAAEGSVIRLRLSQRLREGAPGSA